MKDNKNNNFESIVPEIVKGTDNLHVADILYNNICSVVPFPKLLRYSGRLIQNNSNHITDLSENYIKANRFGEELSINVDKNRFQLYTTEWGKTDINSVFLEKCETGYLFARHTNEVKYQGDSGSKKIITNVLFDNLGNLIYTSQSEIIDMDYWEKKNHITKYHCVESQIFIDTDSKCAYKENVVNGIKKYHMIKDIPYLTVDGMDYFKILDRKPAIEIDQDTFSSHEFSEKIKTLRK